eukprot:TRINITY_DN60_c0_g1_i1.p1 TRINITY_DN60_c0_g1~~TRINITY_DN60_c0_g1_i1.p1  ORF type:complete len:140 (-),score=24.04 TRINITY_DN60_c0_g1_i1:141-560(-)
MSWNDRWTLLSEGVKENVGWLMSNKEMQDRAHANRENARERLSEPDKYTLPVTNKHRTYDEQGKIRDSYHNEYYTREGLYGVPNTGGSRDAIGKQHFTLMASFPTPDQSPLEKAEKEMMDKKDSPAPLERVESVGSAMQ